MANTRTYARSFAGGEISPEMFGRLDDAKFQTGAATLRNFIVTPTGAAKNRAGFAYVNSTKNNGAARLIPFTYSLNQTMVIELGNGYARFHTMGATLKYATAGVRAYVGTGSVTFSEGAGATLQCTWAAHGLLPGDQIGFSLGGLGAALPPNLSLGTQYYVVGVIDANNFTVGSSATAALGWVSAGTGMNDGYFWYYAGAIVSYGGAYYVLGSGSAVFAPPHAPWYLLPADLTYEIPTPYQTADLFNIHYAQSADVMTLVHPNYPPSELKRLGATDWTLTPIAFGPPLATPQNVAVAASPGYQAQISTISLANPALITTVANHTLALGDGIYIANLTATIGSTPTVMDGFYMVDSVPVDGSGNLINNELTVMDYSGNVLDSSGWASYQATNPALPITIQYGTKIFNITNPYAVQAIASDGVSTSLLSGSASVLNNLDVPGSYNTVSWGAVTNAASYNVYKQFNGLWGYIGNTTATSFVDNNIATDMSIVPGIPDTSFSSGPGYYPGAVCYFQQRRCFAGATNAPNNAWMSNSGTESMFSYSLPSLDTDRISFQVAALQADIIQHMLPMLQLILLTSESEFALSPGSTNAITPTNVSVVPQSYIGSSNVQPTIINTTMVYAAARGGHVREMGYAWTVNGYSTGDLSLRASHLFDNLSIVDQAYSKAPWPIVWFVSSSGKLLGLTYIPDEEIGAWHEHDTEGTFQSICCVAEGVEDVLYAVVSRTINGQAVNYIERMQPRLFSDPKQAFFVDAGISQTFTDPVTNIGGLTWLEGATVNVLVDGGVQTSKVVTGGAIALDHAGSVVTVGLPFLSDLLTLPAVLQLDGYGQGRRKNVNKAWIKVYQSSGILVGPDDCHLTEVAQRTNQPYGSPPALKTAELEVMTTPDWQENGQTLIRQKYPLPLEVVGLTLEVAIGG